MREGVRSRCALTVVNRTIPRGIYVCMCVCVCVRSCVRESGRDREWERERERESVFPPSHTHQEDVAERGCMCVDGPINDDETGLSLPSPPPSLPPSHTHQDEVAERGCMCVDGPINNDVTGHYCYQALAPSVLQILQILQKIRCA